MNLVHHVGVVFESQDRLTRTMERVGNKFVQLEKHQKTFTSNNRTLERSLTGVARQEENLARLRARNSVAAISATMQQMKMTSRLQDIERQREVADAKYTAARNERMLRTFQLREQIAGRTVALERSTAARLTAIQDRYTANRTRATEAADARLAALSRAHARGERVGDRANEAGTRRLSSAETAALRQKIDSDRALLTRMSGYGDVAEAKVLATNAAVVKSGKKGLSQKALDAERSAAIRPFRKQMIAINGRLAQNEKLIQQSERLDELALRQAALQADIDAVIARRATTLARIAAAEQAEIARATEMEQQRAAAKYNNDLAEMERLERKQATAQEAHEQVMLNLRAEAAEQELLHDQTNEKLRQEAVERTRVLSVAEATLAADRAQRDILAEQNVELGKMAAHREAISAAWGTMASGAGIAFGGLLGLGALGFVGNKYAHYGMSYQNLQTSVALGLNGHPGTLSRINSALDNTGGYIPGTHYRMAKQDLLEIVHDEMNSDIGRGEILGIMPALAKLKLAFGLQGRSGHGLTAAAASVFDRAGITTAAEANRLADVIVKGQNVSGRLTMPALLSILAKGSAPMRLMNMSVAKSVPVFDLFLAGKAAPATISTNVQQFLMKYLTGGYTKAQQSQFTLAGMDGFIPMASKGGHVPLVPARASYGSLLLNVLMHAMHVAGAKGIDALRGKNMDDPKNIDILAGLQDHMSQRQRSLEVDTIRTMIGGRLGMVPVLQLGSGAELHKYARSLRKNSGALGVDATLSARGATTAMAYNAFGASLKDFNRAVGEDVLPAVAPILNTLTSALDGLAWVCKKVTWLPDALGAFGGGVASLLVVIGGMRVAVGIWQTVAAFRELIGVITALRTAAVVAGGSSVVASVAAGGSVAGGAAGGAAVRGILAGGGASLAGGFAATLGWWGLGLAIGAAVGYGFMKYVAQPRGWFGMTPEGGSGLGIALPTKSHDAKIRALIKSGHYTEATRMLLGPIGGIPDLLHAANTHLPGGFPQGRKDELTVHVKITGDSHATQAAGDKLVKPLTQAIAGAIRGVGAHTGHSMQQPLPAGLSFRGYGS